MSGFSYMQKENIYPRQGNQFYARSKDSSSWSIPIFVSFFLAWRGQYLSFAPYT